MPNVATSMARVALPTVIAIHYTVPAATSGIVTEIILSNTTVADISVTVEFGGLNLLTSTIVPANGIITVGLKQVLAATNTLRAFATAAGVNMFVSGVHVT